MTSNVSSSYIYDAENRLISTAGMSYLYDGDGKRVEKCTAGTTAGTCATNPTGTLYWTGTGSDPLVETDLSGNTLENYIFFNGRRIARREPSTKAAHYYFSDHLGTHSLITDANGTMPPQEESDFYPYGGEIPVSGSDSNHYKFTGKERDAESGLDNFGARFDASTVGRFMTIDSGHGELADPQTLNKYAYVTNNPLRFIDPDGLERVGSYEWTTWLQVSEPVLGWKDLILALFGGQPSVEHDPGAFAPRWPNQPTPDGPWSKGEPNMHAPEMGGGGAWFKRTSVTNWAIDVDFDKNGKAIISEHKTDDGEIYSLSPEFLPEDPSPEMSPTTIDKSKLEAMTPAQLKAVIAEASKSNDPGYEALRQAALDVLREKEEKEKPKPKAKCGGPPQRVGGMAWAGPPTSTASASCEQ